MFVERYLDHEEHATHNDSRPQGGVCGRLGGALLDDNIKVVDYRAYQAVVAPSRSPPKAVNRLSCARWVCW